MPGGGIGLACVLMLAECGVHVTATDIKERPAELDQFSDKVSFIRGDITQHSTAAECRAQAETAGGVDYLVTSAGIFSPEDGSMLDVEDALVDRVMQINVHSAIRMARELVPLLRQSPAPAMVHVASVVGLRNMENIFDGGPSDAYQLSKAAMVSASRSLAVQLARDGIRLQYGLPDLCGLTDDGGDLRRSGAGSRHGIANATRPHRSAGGCCRRVHVSAFRSGGVYYRNRSRRRWRSDGETLTPVS